MSPPYEVSLPLTLFVIALQFATPIIAYWAVRMACHLSESRR